MKQLIIVMLAGFLLLNHSCKRATAIPWKKIPAIAHPSLTEGGVSLMNAYQALFLHKPDCIKTIDTVIYYSFASTMPADEYGVYSTYPGKVSFVSMYATNYPDYARNIWDFTAGAFTYYGACPPDSIIYPYPTNQPTDDDVFLIKFIAADVMKKYSGNPVWENLDTLAAIQLKDIKSIDAYYLEDKNGYINQRYPDQYGNKKSALGITCVISLKNGTIVSCYLITNDMQDTPLDHVLWKK